jgi:hypothetical protein
MKPKTDTPNRYSNVKCKKCREKGCSDCVCQYGPQPLKQKPRVSHTPGPWTTEHPFNLNLTDRSKRGVYSGDKKNWSMIAEINGGGGLPIEANARLIAAAPELLEACKSALACEIGSETKLKNAIAKATAQ